MSDSLFICSCLCKNIKYSVNLINLKMGVCHCSMCRKNTSGTGFSFFYSLSKPIFISRRSLATYSSNGTADRAFCNQCGTTIYYHRISEQGYCIPSGLLENLDENKVKFDKEWYYSDKPSYYCYANNTDKI